jgi:hypothetical protein
VQADGLGSGPLGSLGAAMPKVAEAMRRVAVNVKRMVASLYFFVLCGKGLSCQDADV